MFIVYRKCLKSHKLVPFVPPDWMDGTELMWSEVQHFPRSGLQCTFAKMKERVEQEVLRFLALLTEMGGK